MFENEQNGKLLVIDEFDLDITKRVKVLKKVVDRTKHRCYNKVTKLIENKIEGEQRNEEQREVRKRDYGYCL